MDDTARTALAREVLTTHQQHSEADDGARFQASPGNAVEALAFIMSPLMDDTGRTAKALATDGWITETTAARITTDALLRDHVDAAAIVGITPGQWRIETGADPAMTGTFDTGRLECARCTWYAHEIAAGHDTIAASFGTVTDLAELLTAAAAHQCPALVTAAWEKAHADGH